MKMIGYHSNGETVSQSWLRRQIGFYLGQVLIYLGLLLVALAVIWLGVKAVHVYAVYQEIKADPLPQLVANLVEVSADLAQIERQLQTCQAALEGLGLDRLSPSISRPATWINQYLSQMISNVRLAQRLPALLGQESPQTYLILMQNSDELRPAGGYITAAGHITFHHGEIAEFSMQDSYAVDQLSEAYPYPPEPLYQYMAADYWVLRDASWSPDFPTTARTAIELYQLGQGISAKGVIALDQQALPHLLRAFEPVVVEDEQVTSDNVIQLMRQHWAPAEGQKLNQTWWSQRKSFMLALAETIQQKVKVDFGSVDFLLLAQSLRQALAEKHLLLYLEDPSGADYLAGQNWAGELAPHQGDYLMVVDANIGFNKASAMVERQLNYQITLTADGSAQAHLTLFYQHQAKNRADSCSRKIRYDPVYEQNMERCYWDYLRVIVPDEAQLISGPQNIVAGQYLLRGQATTGEIDIARLGSDKLSWGQLFLLAPEKTLSLDYVYTLPAGTAQRAGDHWEYRLYLQKQPGTLQSPAQIILVLPGGAALRSSQPQPLEQQGKTVTYELSLSTDHEILLSYSLP